MEEALIKLIKDVVLPSLNNSMTPFPIDKKICTNWANDLPNEGETILYTGCMYQISPLLEEIEQHIDKFTRLPFFTKLSALVRFLKPKEDRILRSYKILKNIANLLKKNSISFAYLYEEEPYSGALLLEFGLLKEFREYIEKVFNLFQKKGIKRIITVDPHSYNALVRGKELLGVNIEIIPYFELISKVNVISEANGEKEYVIHDSCLYFRFHNKRGYKDLAEKAGVKVVEDWLINDRENGTCCGYPIYMINKELSEKIAKYRVSQLNKVSKNIIVVCPFCYMNLSRFGNVIDLAELIT
ncbi:MAG: (Fe-S)-binding protein [Sulfolobaceae archaeon]